MANVKCKVIAIECYEQIETTVEALLATTLVSDQL